MMMKYYETDSFKKEFAKLKKRFRTLDEDLNVVKRNAIELLHLQKIDNNSIVKLTVHENISIYKIRKFACRALKGSGSRSGLRLTYALNVINHHVTFIEVYFKADQENEDSKKIEEFIESTK